MTRNKSRPIALLLGGLLWAGLVQAQESANTSGGNATGDGGTLTYSVGQVVYTTNTGANGTVSQGVQQTFEISIVTGIKETALSITLSAFPNPTATNLTLQISDYNNEKLTYQLLDMQGKLMRSGEIVGEQTQIDMKILPSTIYFVNIVSQENKIVKSFKIVKNK